MNSGTIKHNFDTIARLAEKAFAHHELTAITEDDEGQTYVYQCKRPKEWAYGFTVVFRPGFVVVYGDTGDIVLNCNDGDSRAWVQRQRAPHFDYMLKKRPEGCKPADEFMPDEVRAWFMDQIKDAKEEGQDGFVSQLRLGLGEWLDSDQTPDDAYRSVCEAGDTGEVMEGFYVPNSTSLWGCHALMCWKRLFEAKSA